MKASWKQGLEPEMKKEIEMAFKSSLVLRKRMVEILEKKVDSNYKTQINKDNYECPNWSFKQADSVGYARALKEIIELIS